MSDYKHILVPTDFSTYSENAAVRARDLAARFGARVTIVHVVDYLPPGYLTGVLPAEFASEEGLLGRARKELTTWASRIGLESADQEVVIGQPKHEIGSLARERGIDLIVIGTSGMGGIRRLLGSTTNGVLHDTPCDVLSVQAVATG